MPSPNDREASIGKAKSSIETDWFDCKSPSRGGKFLIWELDLYWLHFEFIVELDVLGNRNLVDRLSGSVPYLNQVILNPCDVCRHRLREIWSRLVHLEHKLNVLLEREIDMANMLPSTTESLVKKANVGQFTAGNTDSSQKFVNAFEYGHCANSVGRTSERWQPH